MALDFSGINWLAVLASIVAGQVISTLWFTVIFGEPWAKEYGAPSRREHTKEVPGYTYGVQALCTVVTVLGLALLQRWLSVESVGAALGSGLFVAIAFVAVNILPGQAFLKRWRVAALTAGCQSTMILAISLILGVWR